jgi:hypothetical protein
MQTNRTPRWYPRSRTLANATAWHSSAPACYSSTNAVGEVIRFADVVRMRRQRESRRRHSRVLCIITASVAAARQAAAVAPVPEREVWLRRVRKLEELEAWVNGGVA